MAKQHSLIFRLSMIATVLAFVVVVLGAYTRLTHSGLGCPDWPGCYGHMVVPHSTIAIEKADSIYPGDPVEASKAWTEMIHRYVAGSLALLVFSICFLAWRRRHTLGISPLIPTILPIIIILQALLGMWTVTLKLNPLVVMGHLIGGLTTLSLLWVFTLRLTRFMEYSSELNLSFARPWAAIGFAILILQIILGGWTSANYAGLVCPDFPYCQGVLLPPMDIAQALNFGAIFHAHQTLQGVGNIVRVTIHMMHRIGAAITGILLMGVSLLVMIRGKHKWVKLMGLLVIDLVILQIILGILNVVLLLPLWTAVLHNACAALLLLSVITLNVMVYARSSQRVVYSYAVENQ